jgi:hypothetical protein
MGAARIPLNSIGMKSNMIIFMGCRLIWDIVTGATARADSKTSLEFFTESLFFLLFKVRDV